MDSEISLDLSSFIKNENKLNNNLFFKLNIALQDQLNPPKKIKILDPNGNGVIFHLQNINWTSGSQQIYLEIKNSNYINVSLVDWANMNRLQIYAGKQRAAAMMITDFDLMRSTYIRLYYKNIFY